MKTEQEVIGGARQSVLISGSGGLFYLSRCMGRIAKGAPYGSPDTPVSVRNARTMARAVLQSCKRAFEVKRVEGTPDEPKSHNDRTNRPLSFVRAHLSHGIIDMVVSLLGLAVVINALYVQNCKLRYLPST